ncbi:type II secretion system protein [Coraliomargarita parva]|uniref:type II secretion system protein n=1 Tax=Coraliomargarita parva TaxID=3014050 RepID=UPI0022B51C4C|nr:type II secretion system protein [Coraliomargarita parva]
MNTDRRTPKQIRAFTLIELLVCIAIIAILTGILIPAVAKVKSTAVKSECASRLRHLALACRTYANEHKGIGPDPSGALRTGLPTYALQPHFYAVDDFNKTLGPYIGNRFDTMYCPGPLSEDPRGIYDPEVQRVATTPSDYTNYQYFNRDSSSPTSGAPKAEYSVLFKNVLNSSNKYALWGCLTYTNGSTTYSHDGGRSTTSTEITGMNASYPDGSVRWVEFDELEAFSSDGLFLWPKPM